MEIMKESKPSESRTVNYVGPSMNPILKSGDRLRIIPYNGKEVGRGDVVAFLPSGGDSKIIHRVVSVSSRGIRTRGDNSSHVDQWILRHDQILGRIVSAQRGNKRRRIFGGTLGRLFAVTVRAIHGVDSCVSFLLRPAYRKFARAGIFIRLLPAQMRPRVISLNREADKELQLLMGRRVIGRWLPGKTGWHIRRPFRLFVDEEALPENPGKASVVSGQWSVVDEDI
jgi:hypothetical protein